MGHQDDKYLHQKNDGTTNLANSQELLNAKVSSWDVSTNHSNESAWELNQIIEKIDVGIVVLDMKKSALEYRNPKFFQLIQQAQIAESFKKLYALFFNRENSDEQGDVADISSGDVKLNDRVLEFSIYHIAERYCAIFIRDITERRRLEAIAQAANSLDNLGFIFSGIRHEVGNPINSLKMTLSVLKQNLIRFPTSTVEEYVDRGLSDIGRVEYLLKSLRNFSMFETAHLIDTPFHSYITTFESLAKVDLGNRGIKLTIDIAQDAPSVQLDPRAMNQVLLNIVSNAADALDQCPKPEIKLTAQARENILWLDIEDNGCGISPEQRRRLFQPFNSNKPEGSGLGLVITQKLLALMGSSIDIESQVGKGTCVTVGIPISEEKTA